MAEPTEQKEAPEENKEILYINSEVEKLCSKLKDSLVIITADHGLCDSINLFLEDYPELYNMLKIPPSIEPGRAMSLFVKDGLQETFKNEFNKHFGNSFRLMTKEEVFSENILGYGEPHPRTLGCNADCQPEPGCCGNERYFEGTS